MQVVVLKLDNNCEKCNEKVMRTVFGHSGLVSVALDIKDQKLTVTGDIDPVNLVIELRKLCPTKIVSVVPPKAPKKDEKKKDEKKAEPKKEEPKIDKKR